MNRTILLLLVALCYPAAVFAQEETGAYKRYILRHLF